MNFSPEGQLIMALAVQDMTENEERTARDLIRQARQQFNWPLFADQAAQHKVAPLISRQLRRLQGIDPALQINHTAAQVLQALEFYHAARNAIALAELDTVLDAAREASLPVLPRKGGHLARLVYREPGLRPMEDLDLLVAPDHIDPFVAVLERLGCQQGQVCGDRVLPLGRREQIFWRLYGSDLPRFIKTIGNGAAGPLRFVGIDVNIALVLPGKGQEIPVAEVLDRAVTNVVNGRQSRYLAPEDTVLDLCTHIYKNSTALRFMHETKHRRLIKYVDVREYLSSHAEVFSWDVLLDRAIGYGVTDPVYFALAHLNLLFPDRVPPQVLDTLRGLSPDPGSVLRQYGQWDLPKPLEWATPFGERFFRRDDDRLIPPSRSLV
jgi:hypothetical protein